MKKGEKVQDFINRVLDMVYEIRMINEHLLEMTVISKILRSRTPKFSDVIYSIVEEKNLNTLTIDELSGFLKSHESLLNIEVEQEEEKALHIKSFSFGEYSSHGG